MTDREELHRLLNERFPRFAQHLPFDQRDAIVQTILGAVAPSSPAPHTEK